MFGSLGSLKAGQQGGGHAARRKSAKRKDELQHLFGQEQPCGPAQRPGAQPQPRSSVNRPGSQPQARNSGSRQQAAPTAAAAPRAKLPNWIHVGQRLGYLSKSTGKLCEVLVDKVVEAKKEVVIVFAEDRQTWKGIPFSVILSRQNPLRRLSAPGSGGSVNEMLHAAQASKIDKAFLFERVVGKTAFEGHEGAQPSEGSNSAAAELGSLPGSGRSRSPRRRSASPSPQGPPSEAGHLADESETREAGPQGPPQEGLPETILELSD